MVLHFQNYRLPYFKHHLYTVDCEKQTLSVQHTILSTVYFDRKMATLMVSIRNKAICRGQLEIKIISYHFYRVVVFVDLHH